MDIDEFRFDLERQGEYLITALLSNKNVATRKIVITKLFDYFCKRFLIKTCIDHMVNIFDKFNIIGITFNIFDRYICLQKELSFHQMIAIGLTSYVIAMK